MGLTWKNDACSRITGHRPSAIRRRVAGAGKLPRSRCGIGRNHTTASGSSRRAESSLARLCEGEKWDVCLEIARTVTELEPEKPGGWIDYAQSLHRVDRTQESYDVLSSVANRFPEHPTVFYHLVVYGCHLRKLREAWSWLERAFTCPNTSQATITQLFDY